MIIQHNVTAMNSHRQLFNNNMRVAKNLEKLSSGYKINRAGDDAAGLGISEKMRAQIKGLETATQNAKDGISLIQTAEGALTEVHSMLNRMVELATKAANGTYGQSKKDFMSCELTGKLGLSENVFAMDSNCGCAGFVYCCRMANALLALEEDFDAEVNRSRRGRRGGGLSPGRFEPSFGLAFAI